MLHHARPDDTTRALVREGAGTRADALLLVNDAGLRVVALPPSGELVIGRGSDADVCVADSSMSRRHARLSFDGKWVIRDLDSANGTFVRGALLHGGGSAAIEPGDAVELGSTLCVLRAGFQSVAPPPDEAAPEPTQLGANMSVLLESADRVASSTLPVLILGATGTGKDVLAERIHRHSPRRERPFLRVNCAALSSSLLESELFGHEKGAFTGAAVASPGLLRSAEGGSVFLDEIGELSPELQAKLLLVVERREVLAVGALRPRPIDVRFIAATNVDLAGRIAQGKFRADLYFRLNGLTLELPALRERRSEIAGLARQFARESARALGQPSSSFTPEAMRCLEAYSWPGNVRELRAVVERAIVLHSGTTIEASDLALPKAPLATPTSEPPLERGEAAELALIREVLERFGGNQSRAAKELGIARNTLLARLDKYGLSRPVKGH